VWAGRDWRIVEILVWGLALTNIVLGIRLIIKSNRMGKETKKINEMLDQVKELRESYEKETRMHIIPTPDWHPGWQWN
jgi:hypothetical protein